MIFLRHFVFFRDFMLIFNQILCFFERFCVEEVSVSH